MSKVLSAVEEGFFEAVKACDVGRVQNYMTLGIGVNIADKMNRTPLLYAVNENDADMVEFLLMHRADPNIADENGSTPLHIAIDKRNFDMVEKMLEAGGDINARGGLRLRPTLLHCAVLADCVDEAKDMARVTFLMERGADPSIEDDAGLSVVDSAKKNARHWDFSKEIFDYLVNYKDGKAAAQVQAALAANEEKQQSANAFFQAQLKAHKPTAAFRFKLMPGKH